MHSWLVVASNSRESKNQINKCYNTGNGTSKGIFVTSWRAIKKILKLVKKIIFKTLSFEKETIIE